MATNSSTRSYCQMLAAFRQHCNFYHHYSKALEDVARSVDFQPAIRSCISLGTGSGRCELEFVSRCRLDLLNFIAVEPDGESVDELRRRLETHLPGVDKIVHEVKAQNWKPEPEETPVDLVLVLLCLHYLGKEEREALYRRIYHSWIRPGGFLIILAASRSTDPDNIVHIVNRFIGQMVDYDEIEKEITNVGFRLVYSTEMEEIYDLKHGANDLFVEFVQFHTGQLTCRQEIIDVIQELFPHGKTAKSFDRWAVFRKLEEDNK